MAEGGKAVADQGVQGKCRVLELQEEEEIRRLTSPGNGKGKEYILTRASLGKAQASKVLSCGTLRLTLAQALNLSVELKSSIQKCV